MSKTNVSIIKSGEIKPSTEQIKIINAIYEGHNVLCDAVAGSGKTTTILSLAKKCADKKILQITYNSHLKLEVRGKIKQHNLTNVEIHTYHSLAVKYYDRCAHEDTVLQKIIINKVKPIVIIPKYDIVVIDEAQDMTLLYYQLVKRFINDIGHGVKLLILGDKHQGIYEFKGADTRHLTLAAELWQTSMKKLTLQTSYRVTKPIAWFVNRVMLGDRRITSIKLGYPVTYMCGNPWASTDRLIKIVIKYIRSQQYKPDDIFVLAPSLRGGNAPCKYFENKLVMEGIKCYVPISDECRLNDRVAKGKIVFSTFHQSKGRERKVVIVYGFDKSYFIYYNRNCPNTCPSELYVAITRASEKLIVIEGDMGPLEFLKKNHAELKNDRRIKLLGNPVNLSDSDERVITEEHHTNPTELVKFLDEETCNTLIPIVDGLFKIKHKPKNDTKIPSVVETANNSCEEVSDLNGLVIPAMYTEKYSKHNHLLNIVKHTIKDAKMHPFIEKQINKIANPCIEISDNLYLGNVYSAIVNKYYFKLVQIDNYNWLTKHMVDQCHNIMKMHIGTDALYEYKVRLEYESEFGTVKMIGFIDAIDNDVVWEFKCVDELTMEHMLQLIVYAWMLNIRGEKMEQFKLLNIRTGEVRVLVQNWHEIDDVMKCLFSNKYMPHRKKSDQEFIEEHIDLPTKITIKQTHD